MARTKITVYVTPDIAETLKRVAAIDDRSMSDIIEDAIMRRLGNAGRDVEHAALMARHGPVRTPAQADQSSAGHTFRTDRAGRALLSERRARDTGSRSPQA